MIQRRSARLFYTPKRSASAHTAGKPTEDARDHWCWALACSIQLASQSRPVCPAAPAPSIPPIAAPSATRLAPRGAETPPTERRRTATAGSPPPRAASLQMAPLGQGTAAREEADGAASRASEKIHNRELRRSRARTFLPWTKRDGRRFRIQRSPLASRLVRGAGLRKLRRGGRAGQGSQPLQSSAGGVDIRNPTTRQPKRPRPQVPERRI